MNKRRACVLTVLCIILASVLIILIYLLNCNIYDNQKIIAKKDDYYTTTKFYISPNKNDYRNISIEKLSGAITLQAFSIIDNNDVINFDSNIDVIEGNFKLVLVDTNNEIILETVYDGSKNYPLDNYELACGNYAIKAVGINAKIEGDFIFTLGQRRGTE